MTPMPKPTNRDWQLTSFSPLRLQQLDELDANINWHYIFQANLQLIQLNKLDNNSEQSNNNDVLDFWLTLNAMG
jgi:hypothetical protein